MPATLRGMMTAAIESAKLTESGVMLPDHVFVTAGRLLSIEAYPRITQILRELSGQGLIGRVPRADMGAQGYRPAARRISAGAQHFGTTRIASST